MLTFLDRKNILSKLSRDFVIFSSCFLPFPCVLITVFLDKKDPKFLFRFKRIKKLIYTMNLFVKAPFFLTYSYPKIPII